MLLILIFVILFVLGGPMGRPKVPRCVTCGERLVTAKSKNKKYCSDCLKVKYRTNNKVGNRERMRASRMNEQLERRRKIVEYSKTHKGADAREIAREIGCSVGYVEKTLIIYLFPPRGHDPGSLPGP